MYNKRHVEGEGDSWVGGEEKMWTGGVVRNAELGCARAGRV